VDVVRAAAAAAAAVSSGSIAAVRKAIEGFRRIHTGHVYARTGRYLVAHASAKQPGNESLLPVISKRVSVQGDISRSKLHGLLRTQRNSNISIDCCNYFYATSVLPPRVADASRNPGQPLYVTI
jgi:hypothetical protein